MSIWYFWDLWLWSLKTRHDTQQGFVQFIIPAQQLSTSIVSPRSSQDSTTTSSIYSPLTLTLGEISKQETSGCKTTIVTIMEPIKHVYRSTLHCQLYPQLWDGNTPLESKTEMNEWLSVHRIGKHEHVPAVSGGTILVGNFRGGENK
jgi:hypothetical protein